VGQLVNMHYTQRLWTTVLAQALNLLHLVLSKRRLLVVLLIL
jgi:hypothetical protein